MKSRILRYLALATAAMAGSVTNLPGRPVKTVRVMAIGNSFSRDPLAHLPFLAQAAGHPLVTANAIILGGSYQSPCVAPGDTPILKRIAHAVASEGLRPATPAIGDRK